MPVCKRVCRSCRFGVLPVLVVPMPQLWLTENKNASHTHAECPVPAITHNPSLLRVCLWLRASQIPLSAHGRAPSVEWDSVYRGVMLTRPLGTNGRQWVTDCVCVCVGRAEFLELSRIKTWRCVCERERANVLQPSAICTCLVCTLVLKNRVLCKCTEEKCACVCVCVSMWAWMWIDKSISLAQEVGAVIVFWLSLWTFSTCFSMFLFV